jgi:WD40 repeat protein
MKSVV